MYTMRMHSVTPVTAAAARGAGIRIRIRIYIYVHRACAAVRAVGICLHTDAAPQTTSGLRGFPDFGISAVAGGGVPGVLCITGEAR